MLKNVKCMFFRLLVVWNKNRFFDEQYQNPDLAQTRLLRFSHIF